MTPDLDTPDVQTSMRRPERFPAPMTIAEAQQADELRLLDVDTGTDWLYGECVGATAFLGKCWESASSEVAHNPDAVQAMAVPDLQGLLLVTPNDKVLRACRDELARRYLAEQRQAKSELFPGTLDALDRLSVRGGEA